MLKSANIPISFALSILVVWIMLDAWIRPLSFTDEVLPKQWSLWLLPIYIVLFSVCWFILRPFYRANRATGHQIVIIFLIYLTFHIIFFFFNANTDRVLASLYLISTWLFVGIVSSLSRTSIEQWQRLLCHFLYGQTVFLASYALIVSFGSEYIPVENLQWLRIGPLSFPQLYVGEQGSFLRLAGLMNNPNTFAAWLVPGGLFAWFYLLKQFPRRQSFLHAVLLLLITIALLRSGSQTGIYSFLLLALLTSIRMVEGTRRRMQVTACYVTGSLILLAVFAFQGLLPRLLSLNGRFTLWQAGWRASTDSLWFGHGIGSAPRGLQEQLNEQVLYTFHSTPITHLYEFGLIGCLLYGAVFLYLFYRLFRIQTTDLTFLALLLTGWLGLLQFTESILVRPSGFYFIWLSLLAYTSLRRLPPHDSTHT
ncbi:polymerase [Exiguobacterium sp. KKBO11]|uniref:O-antigen ligase family protein n=1 Tax=Exiguobacterium sp. KKBO11 TaxID=1805000 RepID=UPI0007D8674C|nr:O-antigen ligase family protein [Exiguobacterium sp. KKBO11]OAI88768.1 polymerase [Exiguobacterium sp. KKBO11]